MVLDLQNPMSIFRTLVLIRCNDTLFISPLNPKNNPSKRLLCPELKEIVTYVETKDAFHIDKLLSMAKERASRGAQLESFTIVALDEVVRMKEVFKLRKYVKWVEYKFEYKPPQWDYISEDSETDG